MDKTTVVESSMDSSHTDDRCMLSNCCLMVDGCIGDSSKNDRVLRIVVGVVYCGCRDGR